VDFNEYQESTARTAVYNGRKSVGGLVYATLGLTGEAGEVANKVKKILRDDNNVMTEEVRLKLLDEAGDCCWYLSQLITELGGKLEDVAIANIQKLTSRIQRGVIQGSGDNR
jgi:NTP pyrophosphatase (non-canonical NTP hydrolase)